MMPVFTRSFAAGLLLMAATGSASAASPSDLSGTWTTQDGRARVRLEKCGVEQLCGFVVWMKEGGDPAGLRPDAKNPDPARRSRALLGHQLLAGLNLNAAGRYEGQIYNSEDGKKYDVTLWADNPSELKVRGCLIAFLCSTQSWARANDVVPGQLAGATGAAGGPQPDREWAKAGTVAPKRDAKPRS